MGHENDIARALPGARGLALGDFTARSQLEGSYVARLDLDGRPTWLATRDDSEPVGDFFSEPGMASDSAGRLHTAVFSFRDDAYHLVAVSPDGELQLDRTRLDTVEALTVVADRVALGGFAPVSGGTALAAAVELRRPDGKLLDSHSFAASPSDPDSFSSVFAIAASDDGRIAVSGTFEGGAIDLGDGPVLPGPGIDIGGYLAVFEPVR